MLRADQLRDYPIFAEMPEDELAITAPTLQRRAFAKGAFIFYPGNPGLHTYLVKSGLVRLFLCTAEGQELTLKLIGPQQVFGLPLLDDEQVRLIGAVAHAFTILYAIAREDFLKLMDRSPQFMRNIYQNMATDSRRLLLHVRSLATLDLNGRLAAMLLRLAEMNADQQYIVEMPLNQEEFAGWIGASRGRLNQAVHQFQDMGLICVENSEIIIQDYLGLERLSEEQTMEEV